MDDLMIKEMLDPRHRSMPLSLNQPYYIPQLQNDTTIYPPLLEPSTAETGISTNSAWLNPLWSGLIPDDYAIPTYFFDPQPFDDLNWPNKNFNEGVNHLQAQGDTDNYVGNAGQPEPAFPFQPCPPSRQQQQQQQQQPALDETLIFQRDFNSHNVYNSVLPGGSMPNTSVPLTAPQDFMDNAQSSKKLSMDRPPTNPFGDVEFLEFVDLSSDTPPINQKVSFPSGTDLGGKFRENRRSLFKNRIKDVFPDICETFLTQLYAKHKANIRDEFSMADVVQQAFDEILALQPSYPKQDSKKRKRTNENEEDEQDREELARSQADGTYQSLAIKALGNEFSFVQHNFIRDLVLRHKTLHKTYQTLFQLTHPENDTSKEPLTRLRRARPRHELHLPRAMERELQKAKKAIADKEAAKQKEIEEKINEEYHRKAGTLIECQCCFSDIPPNRSIPCDGNEMHLFCFQCVKTGAETQVGQMKYEVKCFDVSGCKAGFNKKLLTQVIGDKLMRRLEYLQQMDEIAQAHIEGLEECPFCDFKGICPPVEEDKEFNCQNPVCEKVSCRLCRQETHIPQTCEEADKERGIPERRLVEEAMTQALIRTCPKCKVSIIKEDGCNKIQCSKCGTLICDVCKKDITKVGYSHFANHTRPGCPTHERDCGQHRLRDEVKRAEQAAVEKILAENGKIGREQLQIKQPADQTEKQSKQRAQPFLVVEPHVHLLQQRPQAYAPQLQQHPAMPNLQQLHHQPMNFRLPMPHDPNIQKAPQPYYPVVPPAARAGQAVYVKNHHHHNNNNNNNPNRNPQAHNSNIQFPDMNMGLPFASEIHQIRQIPQQHQFHQGNFGGTM